LKIEKGSREQKNCSIDREEIVRLLLGAKHLWKESLIASAILIMVEDGNNTKKQDSILSSMKYLEEWIEKEMGEMMPVWKKSPLISVTLNLILSGVCHD